MTKRDLALSPALLCRHCDTEILDFHTTAELADVIGIVGQPRAMSALEFDVGMRAPGYNLFVLGPPGTGKHSVLRHFLEARAAGEEHPPDWCYVNNFKEPHKPRALRLPLGRGGSLKRDMQQFVEELRASIPAAFDSDEYRSKVEQIDAEFGEQEAHA